MQCVSNSSRWKHINDMYLVVPSFQRQGVGDSEPVPVDFKVGRFAVTTLDLRNVMYWCV